MLSKPINYPREFADEVTRLIPDPNLERHLRAGSIYFVEQVLKQKAPHLLTRWNEIYMDHRRGRSMMEHFATI